jgi:hypothetical protein
MENPVLPDTQYARLTRALGWALLAYAGLSAYSLGKGFAAFALRLAKTEPAPAWAYHQARAIFVLPQYIVAGGWLVLIVAVALGLRRQHHLALRLLRTLVPVLLAQAIISLISLATEVWLLFTAFAAQVPQSALLLRLVGPVGHIVAVVWLLDIYRRVAPAPADNEPHAWTWCGVSVTVLVAWLWLLFPAQELRQKMTSMMPTLLWLGWHGIATGTRLMIPVMVYLIVSFFMVRDGLKVLQHDRKALLSLSRSVLALVILSATAMVFWGFESYSLATSPASSGTSSLGLMGDLSLALQWLLLSAGSLLVLRLSKEATLGFGVAEE